MSADGELAEAANDAAEEVLRIIYGDDLNGCAVTPDRIAAVIRGAIEQQAGSARDVAELQHKGFEAVQLLSTPPADGPALSAEELRSLLGARLDQIRTLATKILSATEALAENSAPDLSDQ